MDDKMNDKDKLDEIREKVTIIHTVLIGNGVPGLVEKHNLLEKQVEKNHNNITRVLSIGGAIMITLTIVLNIQNIVQAFGG